jgi:hybrid cluster-associated redox disulfide protein
MATITKKTTIGEVLAMDMGTAKFFLEMGMHCLGCPSSQGESIEEACMVHGLAPDELIDKLNGFLADK